MFNVYVYIGIKYFILKTELKILTRYQITYCCKIKLKKKITEF